MFGIGFNEFLLFLFVLGMLAVPAVIVVGAVLWFQRSQDAKRLELRLDATLATKKLATPSLEELKMPTLLHPRNWNAVTWLTILFWCLWTLNQNLPYDAGPAILSNFNALADQYGFPRQDRMTAKRGFPFTYQLIDFNDTQITGTSFSKLALMSNLILAAMSLVCLVLVCQRQKTFSVRAMFVGCSIIAVPLALYSYLSPGYPVNHWCELGLFLSPQFAAILGRV